MTVDIKENERIDDLQRSNLRIIQNPEKFCFGMDAVLLSGFAKAGKGHRVLDMCTGTGIIPLLMTAKTEAAHFTGLEIQEESADMAERSVRMNDLSQRMDIVCGDATKTVELFGNESFDVVTCNPPYMTDNHGLKNEDMPKAIARHEILCTLEDIVREAAGVLTSKGKLYMVHRPFRLAEIICCLKKYRLEPKRMQLVYPYVDREPNMVLIEALKDGNPRITVEKPLIIYKSPGEYTDELLDIYGY